MTGPPHQRALAVPLCSSRDDLGNFVCQRPCDRAPNRHQNHRGVRNNPPSPTVVLLVRDTPARQRSHCSDPCTTTGSAPGRVPGLGLVCTAPNLAALQRGGVGPAFPIGTFCFCIFHEHSGGSGHQPASQSLPSPSSHFAWGGYEDTAKAFKKPHMGSNPVAHISTQSYQLPYGPMQMEGFRPGSNPAADTRHAM